MLLEKIKQHAGKISFFVLNLLVISSGVFFLKIKRDQKVMEELRQPRPDDVAKAADQCAVAAIETAQQYVAQDRREKIESIAGNSKEVQVQKPVTSTKIIPGQTRTETVSSSDPVSKKSSSSKSATSTKATKQTKTS